MAKMLLAVHGIHIAGGADPVRIRQRTGGPEPETVVGVIPGNNLFSSPVVRTMATTTLTKHNFEETVLQDGLVLIDFWAEWCGPCKVFGPIFEAASQDHGDAVFAKVDTQEQLELSGALGIMSIPTLMVFRDGIPLYSQPGALPAHVLEDLISQARALDMDEVRAEVEARKAEAAEQK